MDRRTYIISSQTRGQAVFSRKITDGVPLEPTNPLRPTWHEWAAGICFVIMLAICAWAH